MNNKTKDNLVDGITNGELGDKIEEMLLDARIDGMILGMKATSHTIIDEINKQRENSGEAIPDAEYWEKVVDRIYSVCYINVKTDKEQFADSVKEIMEIEKNLKEW